MVFMFDTLKRYLGYAPNDEEELKRDEAEINKRLQEEKDQLNAEAGETVSPPVVTNSNSYIANGTITLLESTHGVINHVLCFDMSAAKSVEGSLEVGCTVRYLALKPNDTQPVRIVSIESVVVEQWDHPSDEQIQKQVMKVQEEQPQYFHAIGRSIISKVKSRNANILTMENDDEDIYVDLENIRSTFVPMIGDHLILDARVKPDETISDGYGTVIDVLAIHSNRNKQAEGFITYLNAARGYGEVDRKYLFFYAALDVEYVDPRIGDKVAIDAIESTQLEYNWRCIKVVLIEAATDGKDMRSIANSLTFQQEDAALSTLTRNKNGIEIENDLKVTLQELNERKTLLMKVKNTSYRQHRVLRSIFKSSKSSSQLALQKPGRNERFVLQPNEEFIYEFLVTSKFYGRSNEMFVIHFKGEAGNRDFQIGRSIEIDVVDGAGSTPSIGTGVNVYKNTSYTMQVWGKHQDVIPGMKPNKRANFIYVKIPIYDVPESLKKAVLNLHTTLEINESLAYIVPFFSEPLCHKFYEKYFDYLLYLEEIQLFHNMRRYDMDRAHFSKENEYLALHVANIAETRPSLVVGDFVLASSPWADDNSNTAIPQGIIYKVLHDRILLKFNQSFHDKYNGEDWKLEFHFSRMSLRKEHFAVRLASKRLGEEFLFPSKISTQSPQLDVDLVDGRLMWKKSHKEDTEIQWFNKALNVVQKEAVKNILRGEARPMPYIIFGPPGTGKTVSVIEAILQICTKITDSRILVATPSNSSADLITERILESGLFQSGDFVRLVGYNAIDRECVPPHLLPYCATCDIARDGSTKATMEILQSGLKLRCNSAVLGHHRITIGTCTTLGTLMQMEFPTDHFTHAIIDESGQCIEPDTLIPMTFLNKCSGQVILAGDPMQLGPIVLSRHAVARGLGLSFLSRLLDRFPYQRDFQRFEKGFDPRLVTKLLYCYRSLPSILCLFSKLFYSDDLLPMVSATDSAESKMLKKLYTILPPNNPNPDVRTPNHGVFFMGVRGENRQSEDSPSWYNAAEAKSIFFFLTKLYANGFDIDDIGIITPYQRQVKFIREIIRSYDMKMPKIGTVEEFQGQERNIILVSTVRSTSDLVKKDQKYQLGFVQSTKRMNVAISRARALLVVFGNPHLLVQDQSWLYLLEYCVKNHTYSGCDLPHPLSNSPE